MADDLQGTTHAEGCHTWGHRHYECALAALARKDAEIAELRADVRQANRICAREIQRAERAEARVREAPVADVYDNGEAPGCDAWVNCDVPIQWAGKRVALVLLDTEEAK